MIVTKIITSHLIHHYFTKPLKFLENMFINHIVFQFEGVPLCEHPRESLQCINENLQFSCFRVERDGNENICCLRDTTPMGGVLRVKPTLRLHPRYTRKVVTPKHKGNSWHKLKRTFTRRHTQDTIIVATIQNEEPPSSSSYRPKNLEEDTRLRKAQEVWNQDRTATWNWVIVTTSKEHQ